MAARMVQWPHHDVGHQQVCTYPLEHPEPPLTPLHTSTTSPKAQQTTMATPQPIRAEGRHLHVATSCPHKPTMRVATPTQVSPPSSSSLPSDTDSPTPIPTDTPMTPHGHSRPLLPTLPRHTHANTPRVWSPPCPSKSPPLSSDANSYTLTPRDTPMTPRRPLMPPA